MRRVLIADPYICDSESAENLEKNLEDAFVFAFCLDGRTFHSMMREFDPDLLFVNMRLPNANGLELLRDIRAAGNMIPAILIMGPLNTYVSAHLMQLNVAGILHGPISLDSLEQELRKTATVMELQSEWSIEKELDYILLRLGFKPGCVRYEVTRDSVLEKYENNDLSLTKELYPTVARRIGKGGSCVEKGVRDGVRLARAAGDPDLWLAFFPTLKPGVNPTNEEFLSRMAIALHHRQRPRKKISTRLKKRVNL